MISLVGYSGFVGTNLSSKFSFDKLYNSKNIRASYGTKPDLLVYSGVRSEMFTANNNPTEDLLAIENAFYNMKKIMPKKVVLISTVSVYGNECYGDEDFYIDERNLTAYGKNRLYLEKLVSEYFSEAYIVRLPALYGNGLKKNFIYDYINYIPKLIKKEKFYELCKKDEKLSNYYERVNDIFMELKKINNNDRKELIKKLRLLGFSALNFTDSRSVYQYYNLDNLWDHINIVVNNGIHLINLVTEPMSVDYIYTYLENDRFVNHVMDKPYNYNIKTKYYKLFSGENGYIANKNKVMQDLVLFINKEKERLIICD